MPAFPANAVLSGDRPPSPQWFADLGRETLAAMTEANRALSAGLGAMGEEWFALAKSTVASVGKAATAMLRARTLDELVEFNGELAKIAIGSLIARSTRLSEIGISTASQSLALIGGRVTTRLARLPPGPGA
ncbi:MAG: phasin family protein [Stellaceae bacterium]